MKKYLTLLLLSATVSIGLLFAGGIPETNEGLSSTTECNDSGCNSFNVHYYGPNGYSHTEVWSSGMLVVSYHDLDRLAQDNQKKLSID